jgi:hypothetical protein
MVEPGGNPIDRYVVLDYLSEGGMGAIYLGKKLGAGGFEMEVVLKQLLPEYTKQDEFIDLFLREARLSATLDHANIVHTIDLVAAGAEYFIVMEYLAGADLRTLIKRAKRRGQRFSPKAAIYLTREVLSALAYAHAKRDMERRPLRLIHRDVSPSNILLSLHGEVKLTDFGIAKAATHNSIFYKVKGKIGYMSPEQAKSEAMDHRSDLYSLAVCLFEVITGERLFVHAGLTTTADEIYSQPIPLLSRKVPGLPADLDKIMLKALSIDPAGRYQTASEFQEALLRCAHRNGLLISAPELAQHLAEVCGDPAQWREEDEDEARDSAPGGRGGTEVYDATEDDDDEDLDPGPAPMSIHAMAARAGRPRRQTSMSSLTDLGRLQGVELTSIISTMEEESSEGADPLYDLGGFGQSAEPDPWARAPVGGRGGGGGGGVPVGRADSHDSGEVLAPGSEIATRRPARADTSGAPVGRGVRPRASDPAPTMRVPGPAGRAPATRRTRPRARIRGWMVLAVVLVVGAIAAVLIGLSGPGG